MTRRLTKREKRERAKARKWVRELMAREDARMARLRAEEPALLEIDQARGVMEKAERAAARLVRRNVLTFLYLIAMDACGEPGCRCLSCRAAEATREIKESRIGYLRLLRRGQARRRAAEKRVLERAREERKGEGHDC